MLPRLSAVLECLQDAPGGVEWADLGGAEEYDRVVQEVRQLYRAPGCTIDSSERDRLRQVVKEAAAEGMGTIVVEDIGLAVVVTVSRPHYYSLFTAAHGCDAVLSVVTGNRYELEMNYTQYTNIRSRWTQPRLDLEVTVRLATSSSLLLLLELPSLAHHCSQVEE